MNALKNLNRPFLSFGLEQGDVHGAHLEWKNGCPTFDIIVKGERFAHIELRVPGVYNVKNAIAAAAAAVALGIPAEAVGKGLNAFRGAGRRFEHKGSYHGAEVYDDYAHHPGELTALLNAAAGMGYQRVICAFQPHTFTRTQALFPDFITALKQADKVLLAEIYAAREQNTIGISSADLAKEIPGAEYFSAFSDLTNRLQELAAPGDLILTVGAGDIYRVGEELVKL